MNKDEIIITAPRSSTQRTLVSEATHPARVIGFIQMGTAEDTYEGQKKMFNKIRITWEFPEETHVFKDDEDAKPLVHSQEYTFSMHKKSKLRPIIEGIIGTSLSDAEAYSFNIASIMNLPCLVSIKHGKSQSGALYAKVASTSKLMKGQIVKEAFNPITMLTFQKWNQELFDSLPSFIKEKIVRSDEYKLMKGIAPVDEAKTVDELDF